MIEKQTVFILGAGASRPYGFPTANDLRGDIIRNFRKNYGNHVISLRDKEWERRGYPGMTDVKAFLEVLDAPNKDSIDLFLSRQPRFETIGKLAILLSILRHERESGFADNAKEPHRDWYSHLYDKMARELNHKDSYGEFGRNKIAFVTFNYDRSLERFFFRSLLSFEGATPQKVKEQIDRIAINHVYGKLSPLPWQEGDASKVLEYGADDSKSFGKLPAMSENLYVVHEERTNPEIEKARAAISGAECIFFLGFGYAKENLEALGFPDVLQRDHHIYGTALHRTDREIKDITNDLIDGLRRSGRRTLGVGDQVQIRNCDCVELLREFL